MTKTIRDSPKSPASKAEQTWFTRQNRLIYRANVHRNGLARVSWSSAGMYAGNHTALNERQCRPGSSSSVLMFLFASLKPSCSLVMVVPDKCICLGCLNTAFPVGPMLSRKRAGGKMPLYLVPSFLPKLGQCMFLGVKYKNIRCKHVSPRAGHMKSYPDPSLAAPGPIPLSVLWLSKFV